MSSEGSPASVETRAASDSRRLRLFRGLALVAPVLALLGVEFGLRFSGNHRPTAFWLEDGDGMLRANPAFGAAYVGETQARMPRPLKIRATKEPGSLRVLVLGESAALGDPEPAFGMPRFLQAQLEARFPGRKIEVLNAAITALNSHALRRIAADSTRLGADVWVVYPGNNEVHGPFGPASNPLGKAPSIAVVRAGLLLRSTAIGQWIFRAREGQGDGLSLAPRWAGLETFSKNHIAADDPRLEAVREAYRRNLTDLVRFGVESGAGVVVGTMAVNLPDCPPFASVPLDGSPQVQSEWKALSERARAQDAAGDWAAAVEGWSKAVALAPRHAESRFQLGLARLNAGDVARGTADLEAARDLDTLRFRADSRIVAITREVAAAAASPRVVLVDAAKELKGGDPERPPGADLFFEHVHLRPEGNDRLARLFARALLGLLPEAQTKPEAGKSPATWATEAACRTRLGWNPHAEVRLWTQIRSLCQKPPFSFQSHQEARNRFLDDRLAEANAAARKVGLAGSIQGLEPLLVKYPADWQLAEQSARLLRQGRRWTNAVDTWKRVVEGAPDHVVAWHFLGEAQAQAGDRRAALESQSRALALRPDFVEAALALGQLYGELGRFQESVAVFDQSLKRDPRNLEALINKAVTLEAMGRRDESVPLLSRAMTEHPQSTLPCIRLGEMLSTRKEYPAAVAAFEEAARRDSSNLVILQRLAGELGRADRPAQAEAVLRRAAQVDPQNASVRIDLGVALARQTRFADAIVEFEAALRAQPGNASARTYLERARAMLSTAPQFPNRKR
jgi:tetratricopeptide (TPR) repeat protein